MSEPRIGERPHAWIHQVPEGAPPDRLVDYVLTNLPGAGSRAGVKKLRKRDRLRLNGQRVEGCRRVRPGDRIELLPPGPLPRVYEHPVEIAWADEHLAAVVKPPGLAVNGNAFRTLEHALPFNLPRSGAPDPLPRPLPVHRLDRRTAGLVLVARSRRALIALGRAFEERRVEKRYRAIVVGHLAGEGIVDRPVPDGPNDQERPARSRWRALAQTRSPKCGWLTTLALRPETGRTHQLRRHMAWLGHPILGDDLYGQEGMILRGNGLFLQAIAVSLAHPIDGSEVSVALPELPRFASWRDRQAARWERLNGS